MIVTAHQTNYLPGASIFSKLRAADGVIWLDEVQYTKGGFSNRNRLPDGSWLTVPVQRVTDGMPINRVRIAERPAWRRKHATALRQHFRAPEAICAEVLRPYRLLVGLNVALMRH